MTELEKEILAALEAAHTSLRTFRNVPIDDQQWTSLDEATMDCIESAITKLKEQP